MFLGFSHRRQQRCQEPEADQPRWPLTSAESPSAQVSPPLPHLVVGAVAGGRARGEALLHFPSRESLPLVPRAVVLGPCSRGGLSLQSGSECFSGCRGRGAEGRAAGTPGHDRAHCSLRSSCSPVMTESPSALLLSGTRCGSGAWGTPPIRPATEPRPGSGWGDCSSQRLPRALFLSGEGLARRNILRQLGL